MKQSPPLLIGLGETGCRVVDAAIQSMRQYNAGQEVIWSVTVDYADNQPTSNHASLLNFIGMEPAQSVPVMPDPPPHIANWFLAERRGTSRTHERMLLFQDLKRGPNSYIYATIQRQILNIIEHQGNDSVVLTALIAALDDPIGSSFVIDMAHITRRMAESLDGPELVMWAYLILPDESAPRQNRVRAYAALREIERFMNHVDHRYGYPMYYHPPASQIREVWSENIKEKPFDNIYVFEKKPGSHVEAFIANTISLYGGSYSSDSARQITLNLSSRSMSAKNMLVSTTGASTVTVPKRRILTEWRQDIIKKMFARFLTEPTPEETARMTRAFLNEGGIVKDGVSDAIATELLHRIDNWADYSVEQLSSELITLRPAQIQRVMTANLLDFVEFRDFARRIFYESSITSEINTEKRNRDDLALEVRRVSQFLESRMKLLGMKKDGGTYAATRDYVASSDYANLFDPIIEMHQQNFQRALAESIRTWLQPILSADHPHGVMSTLAFLRQLKQQIRHVVEATHKAEAFYRREDSSNPIMSAWKLTNGAREDAHYYIKDRGYGWRERFLSALLAYASTADQSLNQLENHALLNILIRIFEGFEDITEEARRHMDEWAAMLDQNIRPALEAYAPPPPAPNPFCLELRNERLENSLREQALKNDHRHPLIERIDWHVTLSEKPGGTNIMLLLGPHELSILNAPQTHVQAWIEEAMAPFSETDFDVLAFINADEHLRRLPNLIEHFAQAEDNPLRLEHQSSSLRSIYAEIVIYRDSLYKDPNYERQMVEAISRRYARERGGNLRPSTGLGNSPLQIAYQYNIDLIDLSQEIFLFEILKSDYEQHMMAGKRPEMHIFGGEARAALYENRMAANHGTTVMLHPVVVGLLDHFAQVRSFVLAFTLNKIQISIEHTERGPRSSFIFIDGEEWQLGNISRSAPDWPEAVKFYCHLLLSTPSLRHIDKTLNAAFKMQITEYLASGPDMLGAGHPDIQSFLASCRGTPSEREMREIAAKIDILEEARTRLGYQDYLLEDLHKVFDMILQDEIAQARVKARSLV